MIGLLVIILSVGGVLTNQTTSISMLADCGRQGAATTTTLKDDRRTDDGVLPWNIVLYRRDGDNWEDWCAGTLITPTHVITSAFCVSDADNEVLPATNLSLAARKLFYYHHVEEPNAQLRGVQSVIRHEKYDHVNRHHDIAILVANQSFLLTNHVTVACLDWSTQLSTPSSSVILIASARRSGSLDMVLKAQRYIMVDQDSCRSSAWSYLIEHITEYKLCARTVDIDHVHAEYGAGLMLPQGGRHYLWGVRSEALGLISGSDFDINRLGSYTNITDHMAWVTGHLPSMYRT